MADQIVSVVMENDHPRLVFGNHDAAVAYIERKKREHAERFKREHPNWDFKTSYTPSISWRVYDYTVQENDNGQG